MHIKLKDGNIEEIQEDSNGAGLAKKIKIAIVTTFPAKHAEFIVQISNFILHFGEVSS